VNHKQQQRLYQVLGENVKKHRNQRGITQEQLANEIDLTRTSVVNIEQGRQHPPLHLLIDIARSLKVSLDALIPEESTFAPGTVLDEQLFKDVSEEDKPKLTSFLADFMNTTNSHE
jgi:DNA-binding XRE family transcriptional regulator